MLSDASPGRLPERTRFGFVYSFPHCGVPNLSVNGRTGQMYVGKIRSSRRKARQQSDSRFSTYRIEDRMRKRRSRRGFCHILRRPSLVLEGFTALEVGVGTTVDLSKALNDTKRVRDPHHESVISSFGVGRNAARNISSKRSRFSGFIRCSWKPASRDF